MKARLINAHRVVDLYKIIKQGQALYTDGDLFYSSAEFQILEPDWAEFRRNTAAKILASSVSNAQNMEDIKIENLIQVVLELTDTLIDELKKDK